MVTKRKRNELNLADKVKLIKASECKSVRKLAETFGLGKSTVSDILKKKKFYLKDYEESEN